MYGIDRRGNGGRGAARARAIGRVGRIGCRSAIGAWAQESDFMTAKPSRTHKDGHAKPGLSAKLPRRFPSVALLVETTRSYGRDLLRGINDYARIRGPWLFHLPNDIPIHGIPPAEEWRGDGIIAQPRQNKEFVRQLVEVGI